MERRLSRILVMLVVMAALASGLVNFLFAYSDAEAFQDEMLRQVAFMVAVSARNPQDTLSFDEEIPDSLSRLVVIRAPRAHMPDWLPHNIGSGFHTLGRGQGRMRVFVRDSRDGERVVIAQSTQWRDEIALEHAISEAILVFLILPLLVLLSVYMVRSVFTNVRELAERVDRSPPDRLEALPSADVPAEVGLFVAAINRLMARINGMVEQQRRFIADAAHELRSPLMAVALQAKNVDKADSLQAARERMVPLKRGIHRAERVAEQLLSLAKTQSEGQKVKVDVSRLTRELIQQYQPLAQERAIDLGLDEREHVEVMADLDALTAILKNALDNALAYTPAEGQVTVRLYGEEEEAVVEVVDSGPGISPAERDRVFAPFYRTPGTQGDGSGLGLAIAHDAAARLGGNIRLYDSNPGPGLLFQYRQKRAAPSERTAVSHAPQLG
jgi:two-component system OmpR family sensor kinase